MVHIHTFLLQEKYFKRAGKRISTLHVASPSLNMAILLKHHQMSAKARTNVFSFPQKKCVDLENGNIYTVNLIPDHIYITLYNHTGVFHVELAQTATNSFS